MKKAARIIIVEDIAADAELAERAIGKVLKGCTFHLVETRKDYLHALETFQPDVILADYALPRFDGITALKLARKHAPFTPLIIWTGASSEDIAVDCMKAGASNYLLKEHIKRLGPAVLHALEEREVLLARKQAEETIQNNEKRLRALLQNGLDNICLLSTDGTLLWESASSIGTLNYTPNEHLGRNIFVELMHPDDVDWCREVYAKILQEPGQREYGTFRLRHADGTWHWVEAIITNMLHEPSINAIVANYRDVNEQRLIEEALQNNEKRFRALIENGLDDISLLAADGTLLWESPSTVRNLGYAPGEYLAHNIFEIMHPDDLAGTRKVFARLIEEPGGREHGIFRLRRSDGTWRWVEAIATNFLNEPGINAVVINYRDITERKEAEEALREERNLLRTLIDNIPDRIYAMDIHGRKTLSNTADWQASGGKTMQDVLGKTDFETYPAQLAEEFWQLDKAVLESGKAVINFEEPGLDAEGKPVSILTTKIPLRNSEGKVTGLVGIGRDITERKQVEEHIGDLLSFNEKILNHSAVGILTYEVTGQCVFANEKAASIVGTTVAQLMSQNFRSIESWKKSGLYDLAEKAITTQSAATADIHHISTFGKDAWMTAHCVTFKSKGRDHILLSISDITERKQAEEKLRQSENRYRLAVKATNDVIWESNLQTKQLFWSENARVVFGYSPEEVVSYDTWWDDHLHPDDRERVLSKINDLIEGDGSIWVEEYRFQVKDGAYAYISDRAYIERDANGTPLRMIGAMTDITERKQAEDKLRESENRLILALSGAQMSVWEWDLKTNQILWSPEFFKITGVDEEQFTGTFESFADLIHNDDVERVRNAAEKAMQKQTLFAEEFRIICPDGEVRWLSNLGQAELDASGRHLRLIGTVQDVTQRKQAEIERLALLEIMQGFANTEDLHELLKLIHHSIAQVVYAKNFFVVLYHPDTGLFEEIYSVDQYDPPAPPAKLENSITSYVFRSGEPLLLTQALFDERVKQGEMKLVGTNSASWLGVPLKTSGRTIGVMAVQDYEYDNRYSERDKHLLASIATQVALAIERKQADIEIQQKNDDLALLNAINEAVIRGQELDSILELLGKELSRIFSVQGRSIYSTLYMLSSDRQSIRMQKYFFSSEVASNIEKLIGFSLPTIEIPILEGGHFHQALVSRRSLITTEPQGIKSWLTEFVETSFLHPFARAAVRKLIPQIYKTLNIKSVIVVPLMYGEETIGFWDVSSSGLFTANDQKRIEYIGGQLTSVIQGQQANEKIRRSEEFLQSVQNALSASIAILNETGTIIQVNSAWREFGKQNGLMHPNACIGLNYLEICDSAAGPHAEEAPSVAQAIRAIIAGQSNEARVEYPCHSPDKQRWFTLHITKFQDRDHLWVVLAHEDITERKRVEQALTLFRTQMDHITDAIEIVDPETRHYIDVNEQACRMRGYTREEYLTLTVDDVDPIVATMPWQRGDELSPSGSIVFESMNRRRDGSVFPVEVNLNRIHLDRDYSLAVVRDITERKRAEEALRESEEQYRAIFEGVQDAIFVESLDGRILTVNQRACEMFGYSYEEFLTKTVNDLVPDGNLILTADSAQLSPEPHETFNRRANGEIFPIDISGRLQVINGETVLLVVVRDITERKKAEKLLQESEDRFSSAFEYASIGMALVSPDGRWLRVNWALCELVGYSEEELVQKTFQDITYHDDLEKDVGYVQQVLAGEIDSYEMEKRYIHKSGKLIWVLLSVSLVRDHEGKPLYLISQIQDITERKEAEEALHKSEALYRRAIEVAGAVPYYEIYYDEGRAIKYEFIGEGIRNITGYGPEEFNATLWDSLVEEIRLVGDLAGYSLEEAIRRVRAGENSIWQCEHRLRDRDGKSHWVFEAAVELRDENGGSYGSIGTYQDITERKQAEESLRAEREKMQNYLDIAGVIMLALDQEGTVTLINHKGCEILGYPADQIIGKNWIHTFLPESDREKLQEVFQQLISGGIHSAEYYENAVLTHHGEKRLIAWHNTWVRDAQGKIISILSSGEDITERKRAEEALRLENERFLRFIDSNIVGIVIANADGKITLANDYYLKILGVTRQDFLEDKVDWRKFTPPEWLPADEKSLRELSEHGVCEPYEKEYVREDGTRVPVYIADALLPGPGEQIAAFVLDITERKRSEEALREAEIKYRTLVEQLPSVTYLDVIDNSVRMGQFNTSYVSPQVESLLGYPPEAFQVNPALWTSLIHPDDRERVLARITEYYKNGGLYTDEYRMRARKGDEIWIRDEAIIVHGKGDKDRYSQGVIFDITERKRAETALLESNAKFRTLFEASPDAIMLIDQCDDWPIVDCNTAACQMNGYTRDELIGQPIDILNMQPSVPEERAAYMAEIRKAGVYRVEATHRRKDGTTFPVDISTSLITLGGRELVLGIDRDITERKRMETAEREQRTLAEALRHTAEILSSTLDYGEVLDHILMAVGQVAPHDAATIMLIDGESARVVRSRGYNQRGFSAELIGMTLPLAETFNLRQMLTTRQPEVVSDTWTYAGWKNLSYTDWLRSNVGAPISIYGEVIGFILLDSGTPGFFTPVHAERLEAFANQAALAIHNARLLQQAQEELAERKRAEEELRFEKERLEKIAAAVPGMIGSLRLRSDGSGCMPYASPAIQDVYGFLPADLAEDVTPFFTRVHAEDLPGLHASIQESAETMLPWHGEFRYHHPTKGEVWIEGRSMPLREEDGSIIWHGFLYDITERKEAEEELRASEERFRQLADNIQEVFWMTDSRSGEEIYMSPAAEAIWGLPIETLMHEPNAFINSVLPEDRARVLQNIEKEKNGEKVEMEYRIMRPDGSLRWIWDRAFPIFDDSGKVSRIAGISADITERRESELALVKSQSRYRELFDSSPVSIWEEDFSLVKKRVDDLFKSGVTDLREYFSRHQEEVTELASLVIITDANQASLDLYGVEHKEDLLTSLTEALGGEILAHFPEEILGFLSPQRKFVWEGTERMQDGRQVELVVTGSIPHGYEEDWSKVIVSIIDITERKRAEESLRESEGRYHGLFQNLVDGFALHEIITDDQGRPIDYIFLEVNPAFESMTGLEASKIIGRRVTEVLPGVKNERFIPIYGQVALTGTPVHFEEYSEPLGMYFEINAYSPRRGQFAVTFVNITERKKAESEIRRRAEETSILLKTSLALTHLDLKTTLQTVGDSAKNLFAADGCRIFLMEPDGKSLRCVLALQESLSAFAELRIKPGEGVTGTVAASGKGEIVNEMQNDPRAVQVTGTPEEEEAIMFAPLKERGNTLGVLSVRRTGGDRPFQPADLELLEALASMAASAVSNARLFAETQRRLSELEALYENGLAVGRLLKPNQIGNRLIHTFSSHLPWHHVTIRLRQDTSDDLELVAFSLPNLKEEERTHAEQHFIARVNKVGQGLSGWAIQTGIPLRTGNVQAHPQYIDTHAGIQSGLYMPLKVGERVIGVISVESEVPDAFTEQDERLLATLASQAAIAFENARLYQEIEQELSERKRAQEALLISETHYRALADSITDILFELDQDLRYTHWNKASEIFSGISAEDAIGRSMQELFGTSEEQFRREEVYKSVLQERRARTFETEVFAKGEKRALEINAYPSARGVSVVAKDVTDRKRSEIIMQKRFELMEYSAHHALDELMQRAVDEVSELTGSTIGFFHFVQEDQKTLGMQTWSTNALQLFNVPVSEGTHLPLDRAGVWAEAVHQRRPLIQNDYESLPERKGFPQGHVPIRREIVIPIIRNEKVMATMGIGNKPQEYTLHDLDIAARLADYAWDITERKQMQVALEVERNQLARRVEERTADLSQANSNLARALRVKDEFLANMSHELRTPLNAILGLSESLGEQIAGPLNEKQQKYITTISESGHHLLSLINDILDLAKIEAGQITLDINKVDIHSVCQASLRMVKQLAQKKNQQVFLDIEEGLGLMWADERRLKQMIVNLLGNAVKFTPENGKIGLEVRGDQGANKVTMTVWDTGIGIKENDLARLFQPFVQLDSGLAREATGTGLGLALVAQMARLHGGSVSAASNPGEGSRFSIILPWEPALATDTASRLRTTGKFRAIKPDEANKPTILLVEDTKEVVMMLLDYLELAGYKVVTARDGVEAIAQARLVHPDLILMDVMMPRMDGFEATRKLRSEPEFKYTPIVALTALAMPSDRERCLAAGMNEYISKPINLKALLRVIQSCLFGNQEAKRK